MPIDQPKLEQALHNFNPRSPEDPPEKVENIGAQAAPAMFEIQYYEQRRKRKEEKEQSSRRSP